MPEPPPSSPPSDPASDDGESNADHTVRTTAFDAAHDERAPRSPAPSATGASGGASPRAPSASRASVPPSEPRPSRASFSQLEAMGERPARVQLVVALLLGLVLVAIPLYLWRRPRADSIAALDRDAAALAVTASAPPEDKAQIGDVRIVGCHDPGPRRTPPEQCDHVAELEKAFAKAVDDATPCVTKEAGGGTIEYLADVSFKKRSVGLATPRETRTIRHEKVVAACGAAVRQKLQAFAFDGPAHQHQRYRLAVTVTYPGAPAPASASPPKP